MVPQQIWQTTHALLWISWKHHVYPWIRGYCGSGCDEAIRTFTRRACHVGWSQPIFPPQHINDDTWMYALFSRIFGRTHHSKLF